MSALGHYLEEEGIASVAIALIRAQAENTRPPRALCVPFELGRPIGPPSDAAFQKRVILAALGLVEAVKQASLIVDFPDDDPREALDLAWSPPSGPAPAEAFEAEMRMLAPLYAQSCTERARSTVGLSGLPPAEFGAYIAAWLRGENPASPIDGMSPLLALRFAIDDLKAYALEAAIAGGARPSSKQLGDWLWNQSACGAAIRALRERLMAGDERQQAVAAFFVPAVRLPG
ncbi:MAG TPA: hypothetical protein VN808_13480 [Stellaceae bacterium]|nr:hypothetical protein [Stellaceae bacterium]